ncbi:MAG: hypothetical protein ACRDNO_31515 [Trebonia sp.]
MSDSLPPHGGPDPFDGWDLEGLLSGENVWLPDGMRPVAKTLDSLRSAPVRAELSDEAAARAAFRAIMLPGTSRPAPPGGGADEARTLILPARAADPGPPAVPRPRHAHRRPPRRGRWRSRALLSVAGGAAAVVIVGGVALAGVFSGGNGHPGVLGSSSGATSAAPGTSNPGSNGVEGSASKEPTASPTPSHSVGQQSSSGANTAPGPSELCRQFLESFAHPGSRSDRAAERDDLQQLTNLAGGAGHILGYCSQLHPWAMTQNQPGADWDGPGYPADFAGAGGSQGQGGPGQQQGNAGSGTGGNGP